MKAKMFRALLPLAIVFTMVSCSSDSSEGSSTENKLVTTYNYNESELKVITLVNNYRQSIGLNTLEVINHISYKSQEHNIYMIDNGSKKALFSTKNQKFLTDFIYDTINLIDFYTSDYFGAVEKDSKIGLINISIQYLFPSEPINSTSN